MTGKCTHALVLKTPMWMITFCYDITCLYISIMEVWEELVTISQTYRLPIP